MPLFGSLALHSTRWRLFVFVASRGRILWKDARVHGNLYIPYDEHITDDDQPGLLEETAAVITGPKVGDGYVVFCGDQQ